MPPSEITATSDVPPPMSTTMLPVGSPTGSPDPIAAAEEALAQISGDFSNWMHDECDRLDAARAKVRDMGLSKGTKQELFLAAHDVKGDSTTLGYPEVGPAADSLCRLLEHTP